MTRDEWIDQCASTFVRDGGLRPGHARDYAITEFLIRCHEEPLTVSPLLPEDRWPDPADAAVDAMHEWSD